MGRETVPEPSFVVVLFMQISIVDIEIGGAGFEAFGEVPVQIFEVGPKDIGAAGFDVVAGQVADHAVELAVVDGGPECVFGARLEATPEKVEIASEVIGQDEEPHLVGGPDIQDAFKTEGAGGEQHFVGGSEFFLAPGCFPVGVQGQHEAGVQERVVLQGQVGEGGVSAEISIAALVDGQGGDDIGFEILNKKAAFDIGPEGAGVGQFRSFKIVEGLFAGGSCEG